MLLNSNMNATTKKNMGFDTIEIYLVLLSNVTFYRVFLSVPPPVDNWFLFHPYRFAIRFPMSGLSFLWFNCFFQNFWKFAKKVRGQKFVLWWFELMSVRANVLTHSHWYSSSRSLSQLSSSLFCFSYISAVSAIKAALIIYWETFHTKHRWDTLETWGYQPCVVAQLTRLKLYTLY